jgi:hypothetical protein
MAGDYNGPGDQWDCMQGEEPISVTRVCSPLSPSTVTVVYLGYMHVGSSKKRIKKIDRREYRPMGLLDCQYEARHYKR